MVEDNQGLMMEQLDQECHYFKSKMEEMESKHPMIDRMQEAFSSSLERLAMVEQAGSIFHQCFANI